MEERLPSILHMREDAESLFSSKCYSCVYVSVKIQSECSNNVEVIQKLKY